MGASNGDHEDFDAAASRFASAAQEGEEPEAKELGILVQGVTRVLRARFRVLDAEAARTLAGDAVGRFWEAGRKGLVDLSRRPGAYLTVIARNLASKEIAASRPASAAIAEAGDETDDVELEGVLEREDALALLDAARCQAIRDGDYVAVRVITAWLDLADTLSRSPTSREVAEEAGLSHSTVNRALGRLRDRLWPIGGGAELT